ncbi:MAG: hypothetical protein ACYTBJ_17730 [Planctomycetota bacterium]|jgi:hypothetical protein
MKIYTKVNAESIGPLLERLERETSVTAGYDGYDPTELSNMWSREYGGLSFEENHGYLTIRLYPVPAHYTLVTPSRFVEEVARVCPKLRAEVGGVEYPWGYGWSMINNDILDNNGDFVVTVPKEGGDV